MKKCFLLGFLMIFLGASVMESAHGVDEEDQTNEQSDADQAVDAAVKDTLTLSSSYFSPSLYTNSQLCVFGLELLRAENRLEQYASESADNSTLYKWLLRGLGLLTMHAFSTAFHEIGHGLRGKSFGYDYMLLGNKDDKATFSKKEEFFSYFAKQLVNSKRAACRFEASTAFTAEQDVIMSAGGMNNEMFFAENLSDQLCDKKSLNWLESFALVYSRVSPAIYATQAKKSGDDPYNVQECYEKLGVSVKKNRITTAGVISLLLSSSTYSILKGIFDSVGNNSAPYKATPFTLYGFRLPDVFSYVTSKGISYKLVSGYNINSTFDVIFGIEQVCHGKSETEVNFGVKARLGSKFYNTTCRLVATVGKGFNLEGDLSVPIHDKIRINVGAATYTGDSLLGERHSTNIKKDKKRSHNVFVSLSYVY